MEAFIQEQKRRNNKCKWAGAKGERSKVINPEECCSSTFSSWPADKESSYVCV